MPTTAAPAPKATAAYPSAAFTQPSCIEPAALSVFTFGGV